jgi:hypothetical protein
VGPDAAPSSDLHRLIDHLDELVPAAYSIQIFMGNLAAGANSPTLTVPTGYIYIIRDVEARFPAAAGNYAIGVSLSPSTIFFTIDPGTTVGHQWQGRIVLNPGQQFYFQAVGAAAGITVSGYQLSVS